MNTTKIILSQEFVDALTQASEYLRAAKFSDEPLGPEELSELRMVAEGYKYISGVMDELQSDIEAIANYHTIRSEVERGDESGPVTSPVDMFKTMQSISPEPERLSMPSCAPSQEFEAVRNLKSPSKSFEYKESESRLGGAENKVRRGNRQRKVSQPDFDPSVDPKSAFTGPQEFDLMNRNGG